MSKYFKNVSSYQDLKSKYREMLKSNHPDNGGDLEVMQEINCEYDALFKIWKDRAEKEQTIKEDEKTETAQGTRRHFYTEFGWEGSRYDSNLTLKEISKIVKNYTKEKYPTCKFSVRTHYASLCQELSVDLLEFPDQMYMTPEQLVNADLMEEHSYTKEDGSTHTYSLYRDWVESLLHKLHANGFLPNSYNTSEIFPAYENALTEHPGFYGIRCEYFNSVVEDVTAFVNSYNYNDSDSMIDYFDVNFYFFGVDVNSCKQVVKTARIPKNAYSVKADKKEDDTEGQKAIEKGNSDFSIQESEHTKTHEKIFLVKCLVALDRAKYIELNNYMKQYGGYYSKFTHSFIFKDDPTEFLKNVKVS
jgi:hypothetical protein